MTRKNSSLLLPRHRCAGDGGTDVAGGRHEPAKLGKPATINQHKSYGDTPAGCRPYPVEALFLSTWPTVIKQGPLSTPKLSADSPIYQSTAPAAIEEYGHPDELIADHRIIPNDLYADSLSLQSFPDDPLDDSSESGDSISLSTMSWPRRAFQEQTRQLLSNLSLQRPIMPHQKQLVAPALDAHFSHPELRPPAPNPLSPQRHSNFVPEAKHGGSSSIPALWTGLSDQRQKVNKCRKTMSVLLCDIQLARHEKAKAEKAIKDLTLSFSKSAKALPRKKVVNLYRKIDRLQDKWSSMESRYDELGAELDRMVTKLEARETGFFQKLSTMSETHFSSGPIFSQGSTTEARHLQGTGTNDRKYHNGAPVPGHFRRPHQAVTHIGSNEYSGGSKVTARSIASSDATLLGISGDRPVDRHPVYELLLRTIGDLNMATEGHIELLTEREDILMELQSRITLERSRKNENYDLETLQAALQGGFRSDTFKSSFSSYLDHGDFEFLLNVDDMIRAAKKEIGEKKDRVDRIRTECITMERFPRNMPLQEFQAVFGLMVTDEDELYGSNEMDFEAAAIAKFSSSTPRTALAHWRFSTLLSNPQHVIGSPPLTATQALERALNLPKEHPDRKSIIDACVKEFGIRTMLTRFLPENKSDFINRWLLQQLRTSPLGALHLFSIFSSKYQVMNLARWQEDVIYYWPRDESNRPEQYLYNPVSEPELSLPKTWSLSSIDGAGQLQEKQGASLQRQKAAQIAG